MLLGIFVLEALICFIRRKFCVIVSGALITLFTDSIDSISVH